MGELGSSRRTAGAALAVCVLLSLGEARAQVQLSQEIDPDPGLQRLTLGAFIGGDLVSEEVELGNSFFDDQVPGSGFQFGLQGSYLLLPHLARGTGVDPRLLLEGEGAMTLASTEGNIERDSISTPVLSLRASAVIELFPRKSLVPLVLAGIGSRTVFGENRFMDSPDSDFAGHLGAGVRIPVHEKAGFRVDLRGGLQPARFAAVAPTFEFHVGGYFAFGPSASDRERRAEKQVASDRKLGKVDGDNDGFTDALDRCPAEPEAVNGIDDDDGCPEVDSDRDGLLGNLDLCPAAAEDIDDFQDDDGCPDIDNDGDANDDRSDECPEEAETQNGYRDDDGCADEIPPDIQRFLGTVDGIVFQRNSARLLERSEPTLNALVDMLSANDDLRIEISAHSDASGSAESNREITRKRANYVKWYLVDKGVRADRIDTAGHGPDRPRSGSEPTWRIEIRLLTAEDP